MGLEIMSTSIMSAGRPTLSQHGAYLGALSAALRNGNVVAAQQALLGLGGVAGGLSPAAVFETIDSALKSGKVEEMKSASSMLDSLRTSRQLGEPKPVDKDSTTPLSNDFMLASATGKLVNIYV